ncbi:MAG TPA: hypothetical protein VGI45_02155 [Terracidiphilus sp.]|jgi:hypothetical protein
MHAPRTSAFVLVAFLLLYSATRSLGQAALLMEEPYGFFGTVNPTGHTAIYFAHICVETPTTLRRCEPGELGAVVSRYSDVGDYDWVAIPLIPYLYSVEGLAAVPSHVDKKTVNRLRNQYREAHLLSLGADLPRGGFFSGGWTELIGVAYERRMYAFRFNTTQEQDDAFIARMNDKKNRSHFQLLFNNCSDFSRTVLNEYFPRAFRRNIFPDAGMTTPKQITYKLVRYAKKHPEMQLTIFEIPQVPGYRRLSRANKSISESLITTVYAVPIAALNPYLAGGLFVDYVVRGRYHLIPKNPLKLTPETLAALTSSRTPDENPLSASVQAQSATAGNDRLETQTAVPAASAVNSDLKEVLQTHE